MSRFPFGIPNSWFLVAYSDEIDEGTVRPVPYFGRNMIAIRGPDGGVSVLDGYCPHLGANLAVGATCEDGVIQCPFHGWRYDATGRCIDIPYAKRIPKAARLAKHPVLERNGMIFAWNGAPGAEPFFEIPVLPEWEDSAYSDTWLRFEWDIKTHPQEISENGIDAPHFEFVHQMDPVDGYQVRFEGPAYFWTIGVNKDFTTIPDFQDGFTMTGENWGLGYSLIRQNGHFDTVVVTSFTAIDRENTCMKLAVLNRIEEDADDARKAELAGYMKEHAVLAEQDFAIWENKRYEANPVLCDADGPVAEHRKWAKQFYADEAAR